MKGIKGQLSSLPITDLMQWIDMNKKSGVLFVSNNGDNKCFCFNAGRLLLAAARDENGRLGDFLSREGHLELKSVREAVLVSRSEGVSLFNYMINKKIIPAEFLKVSIQHLAEETIMDILSWEAGSFEFVEDLPPLFSESPVLLNASFIVFESVRKHDEIMKHQGL